MNSVVAVDNSAGGSDGVPVWNSGAGDGDGDGGGSATGGRGDLGKRRGLWGGLWKLVLALVLLGGDIGHLLRGLTAAAQAA